MKTTTRDAYRFLLPIVISGMLLSACSKDDGEEEEPNAPAYVCATCADSPEALIENDNSNKGVYKGIFVGSTGTISINIQNGSDLITATLVIDGVSINLTSSVEVENGQPFVAPFEGIFNGEPVVLTFSVGLSGATPTVLSSDIPGHPNAVFEIYKETSTSLIEAFEGTLTRNGEPGTFNVVLSTALGMWSGVAQEVNTGEISYGEGIINGSNQLLDEVRVIGTITGDEINGSFTGGDGEQVILTGQRTL